jgi:murein DD-endopeptidase MepM/ murein hydrolase activator NlpD
MHRRVTRALLAATALCTLLLPTVGSVASPNDKLQETQDQLQDLRDRIDSHETQASSLRGRIDSVSEVLVDLQIAINELNVEIGRIEAEVRSAEGRIEDTKSEIAKVRERAAEQAVSLYKGGPTEALDALLASDSLGELNDRVEMLGIAAEENTGALIEFGRLKVALQDQYEELFAKEQELNAKLASRQEYEDELESRKSVLAADLAKLNDRLGQERNREGNLEQESEDLRQQILAAQAQDAALTTAPAVAPNTGGASSYGFIWPLNGSVTSPFGYRWGRMHTGIDIDGYTGQPIVASKSGSVISAGDAGDGYGVKVVIDHGGGFSTLYGHMSGLGATGSVSQGQVIGYVGCTGSCTGDHLHFEVRVNGSPQNPLNYLP